MPRTWREGWPSSSGPRSVSSGSAAAPARLRPSPGTSIESRRSITRPSPRVARAARDPRRSLGILREMVRTVRIGMVSKLSIVVASALALLAACAAPDKKAKSKSTGDAPGRVVGVGELPKEHADLLTAYGKGGETWEAARERALADDALTRFLVENLTLEMVRAQRALGGTDARRAHAAYDRARLELVRFGERAVPSLVAFLEVADSIGATEATDVLERIGRPAVLPAAELLDREAPETRRRASALLARLPHSGSAREEEAIRASLIELSEDDREWIVRAEVARALGGREIG